MNGVQEEKTAQEIWVDRVLSADLTTAAKSLGMAVAWIGRDGGEVTVSLSDLSKITSIRSRTTLIRARKELERAGFIRSASIAGKTPTFTLVVEDGHAR